jgi:hypothetical protein
MKRPVLMFITILVIASLACSININIPSPKVGETQTLEISEAAPSATPARLSIAMGGGKLSIQPGGDKLVQGSVEYNVAEWKPVITRDGSDVRIEQKISNGIPLSKGLSNITNKWTLLIGDVPTDLTIEAGAYEGKLDFSGLPLTNLKITDGASQAQVTFDKPNPERMDTLTYETGASNIKLTGLANANFDVMNFRGGAGNFTLDFTGKLTHDAQVNVNGGLGNLTIIVPKGSNARIVLGASLNNVSTEGVWTVEGQEYSVNGEGPTLRIDMNVGVGNLNLINK